MPVGQYIAAVILGFGLGMVATSQFLVAVGACH